LFAIGIFGLAVLALWNLPRVWQGVRSRFAQLWSALVMLAALPILWVMLVFHLIRCGAHY
jgi:hypothetical protein